MKSLVKTKKVKSNTNTTGKKSIAQCCAKISRTAAGCHD